MIDNIDFEEATNERGNIYDKARKTFHATLRTIFQFTLPQPIDSISSNNNNEVDLVLVMQNVCLEKILILKPGVRK